MLPFTKRPGRSDEAADVLGAGEELAKKPMRKPAASETDEDEATRHMPRKALGIAINKILPAAGRPAVAAPLARSRPAPASAPVSTRSLMPTQEDDGEGRTQVRGGPRIVKRAKSSDPQLAGDGAHQQMPTTISPSAVIKESLDAARAGRRPDLIAGPPDDLLEDLADHPPPASRPPPSSMDPDSATKLLASSANLRQVGALPPASGEVPRAYSAPPPPLSQPYDSSPGSAPSPSSRSVPPVGPNSSAAMPAHFAKADPPAVANERARGGRSTSSWAGALLAFGLLVGIGAIAVMQTNGNLMEATASFVDPSRAAPKNQQPTAAPLPIAVPMGEAPKVSVPAAAIPAETAPPPAPVVATAPAVPAVAPAEATPAPKPEPKSEPAPKPTWHHAWTPPAPPAPKPAPPAKEAAPPPPPVAKAEPPPKPEPVAKKPPAEEKPAKGGKPGKSGDVDEETRKALEALQKSQLESSF